MANGLIGRPPKLTPEVQAKFIQALQAGNYPEVAALYAGFTPRAYYKWKALGETHTEGRYFQFLQAIKKAEAEAETAAVALIRKAALEGTWTAAAWFLERKHPSRWALKQKVETAGDPIAQNVFQILVTSGDQVLSLVDYVRSRRVAALAGQEESHGDNGNS